MTWRMVAIVAIVALALGSLLYAAYVAMEAKDSVVRAPKDTMFICPEHGPIQASAMLKISTLEYEWQYADGTHPEGKFIEYCPLCFETRIREAKAKF